MGRQEEISKMTIRDIARISGYSIGTVSRVLNHHQDVSDEARCKIEEVVRQTNFQPNVNAKRLRQKTDSPITLIIRGYENPFFESITEKVQRRLRSANEKTEVTFVDENMNEVQAALRLASLRQPKGFIFIGGNLNNFREDFNKTDIPSVLLTNDASSLQLPHLSSYSTDDVAAGRAVIEYLLQKGHRRIGLIGGEIHGQHSQVGYWRLKGCRQAFQAAGLPFAEERDYEPSRFSLEAGYESSRRLLQRCPDITAIFALSDVLAFGALRAIADAGLSCPEDISLVGYDGIALGQYSIPRLTTIRQDADGLVQKGVEDLLLRLQGEKPPAHEIVPFLFVEGESVKQLEKEKKE